jgi:hypothetical protein
MTIFVYRQLSWVHGYASGRSAANTPISNNLHYNANRDILFHAAALGVRLYADARGGAGAGGGKSSSSSAGAGVGGDAGSAGTDMTGYKQAFYRGHDDDVLCLAISNCRFAPLVLARCGMIYCSFCYLTGVCFADDTLRLVKPRARLPRAKALYVCGMPMTADS